MLRSLLQIFAFLPSIFFCPKSIMAQKGKHSTIDKSKVIFEGNHLSFGFSVFSHSKARVKSVKGSYPISSSAMPGAAFGVMYKINLNKRYSLYSGLELINTGRNFNINIYKNDFSPQLKQDYFLKGTKTLASDMVVSLPVMLEKRLWVNKNFFHGQAGIRFNYSTSADLDLNVVTVENINDEIFSVAEVASSANNNAKPWISYVLSGGKAWVLKNNNIFQASLETNFSFTKYVDGTYTIMFPGKPVSEGSYSCSGTYIGISIKYLMTNANYRLSKSFEKKVK